MPKTYIIEGKSREYILRTYSTDNIAVYVSDTLRYYGKNMDEALKCVPLEISTVFKSMMRNGVYKIPNCALVRENEH